MSATEPEIVRWYTRARRTPQLIGRTPDGTRIPGGPYTITQVVGAGAVLLVGTRTTGLWARYDLFSNALILASVAAFTLWAFGRVPVGARNPISMTTGLLRAAFGPEGGRLAGRPIRIRRPHQVRHRIVVQQPHDAAAAGPPAAPLLRVQQPAGLTGRAAMPTPAGAHRPAGRAWRRGADQTIPPVLSNEPPSIGQPSRAAAPALTAVQALLAQTTRNGTPVAVLTRPPGPTPPAEKDG